jgi:hypothetical protein
MKLLKNFRLVMNKINPSKLAMIINKTDIIIISPYRSRSRTLHIRKTSSRGACDTLEDFGKGSW